MNNQIKFDPITGKPIQGDINNIQPNVQPQLNNQVQLQNIQQNIPLTQTNSQTNTYINEQSTTITQSTNTVNSNMKNMQSIPTVDQTKQEFINNTQSLTSEEKIEKKQGINWTFMIILFVIILASIFFLFPYLQKNL